MGTKTEQSTDVAEGTTRVRTPRDGRRNGLEAVRDEATIQRDELAKITQGIRQHLSRELAEYDQTTNLSGQAYFDGYNAVRKKMDLRDQKGITASGAIFAGLGTQSLRVLDFDPRTTDPQSLRLALIEAKDISNRLSGSTAYQLTDAEKAIAGRLRGTYSSYSQITIPAVAAVSSTATNTAAAAPSSSTPSGDAAVTATSGTAAAKGAVIAAPAASQNAAVVREMDNGIIAFVNRASWQRVGPDSPLKAGDKTLHATAIAVDAQTAQQAKVTSSIGMLSSIEALNLQAVSTLDPEVAAQIGAFHAGLEKLYFDGLKQVGDAYTSHLSDFIRQKQELEVGLGKTALGLAPVTGVARGYGEGLQDVAQQLTSEKVTQQIAQVNVELKKPGLAAELKAQLEKQLKALQWLQTDGALDAYNSSVKAAAILNQPGFQQRDAYAAAVTGQFTKDAEAARDALAKTTNETLDADLKALHAAQDGLHDLLAGPAGGPSAQDSLIAAIKACGETLAAKGDFRVKYWAEPKHRAIASKEEAKFRYSDIYQDYGKRKQTTIDFLDKHSADIERVGLGEQFETAKAGKLTAFIDTSKFNKKDPNYQEKCAYADLISKMYSRFDPKGIRADHEWSGYSGMTAVDGMAAMMYSDKILAFNRKDHKITKTSRVFRSQNDRLNGRHGNSYGPEILESDIGAAETSKAPAIEMARAWNRDFVMTTDIGRSKNFWQQTGVFLGSDNLLRIGAGVGLSIGASWALKQLFFRDKFTTNGGNGGGGLDQNY